MTREEYLEKINDNPFSEEIIPLFDFFESHLYNKLSDQETILAIKDNMINSQIRDLIKQLFHNLYINRRTILRSYCDSLYKNVINFIGANNTEKLITSWKKTLLSYINFSRLIVDDNKIQRLSLQPNNSQKIVLCVSTIELEEDNIRVNEEIANIQELINQTPNNSYLVLPIHGCSTNQFKTRLKNYKITHVHIAGHTSGNKTLKIQFSDSGMKFSTLYKYINESERHLKVLFLNCCSSYEYIEKTPFPFSDITICHETEVTDTTALDASIVFYTSLFANNSINDSWTAVQNSIEDNLYHILHT